jgi:prepilin-type N-terminal cleavage/methylation domain-containing protein
MVWWPPRGFTIVELLIVIVVIGIIASITIVSYNGVQARGQDVRRKSDITNIQDAIEIYKINNAALPPVTAANTDASGWEVSYKNASFIPPLVSSGVLSSQLLDPLNTSTYYYRYYKYTAGSYSCDSSKGEFYVLQIKVLQSQSGNGGGPGFECSGRNWTNESAWTVGGYLN